jgi:hypothetical protein
MPAILSKKQMPRGLYFYFFSLNFMIKNRILADETEKPR